MSGETMDIKNPPVLKAKKQIGRAPKFTPEYYMMMVKHIVEDKLTFREASKIYNVSHGTVWHWLKLYKSGKLPSRIKQAKGMVESQDNQIYRMESYIKNLKTEIGELYLENLMLKKAQGFSQHQKKLSSSAITSENLAQWKKGAK
jgi:transposase-like protein